MPSGPKTNAMKTESISSPYEEIRCYAAYCAAAFVVSVVSAVALMIQYETWIAALPFVAAVISLRVARGLYWEAAQAKAATAAENDRLDLLRRVAAWIAKATPGSDVADDFVNEGGWDQAEQLAAELDAVLVGRT